MNQLKADKPEDLDEKMTIASIRERILFREFKDRQADFLIKHVSKVESNESWDIIYLSAGTEYLAEIKIRDKKLADWDHEGWILEEYKFKALCDLQQKSKRPLTKVYVNIFRDAVVIWNLDAFQPFFFLRDSKATTVANTGRKIKSVAYLQSAQGTIYRSNYNIAEGQYKAQEIFRFLFPNN